MKVPLAFKFFVWGMLVFIAASMASFFHLLGRWELKYCTLATIPKDWRHPDILPANPALLLPFTVFDLDQRTMVERIADIADDLKSAGAKTVVVPLNQGIYRSPENIKSIQRMKKTGIVIIGNNWWSEGRALDESNRNSWWSGQPLAGYRSQDSLESVWAPLTVSVSESQDYYSFIPYGVRHLWGGQTMYDVTVHAIVRFLGVAENSIKRESDGLVVASHKMPLWGEGIAYVKGWRQFSEPWKSVLAESNLMTTRVRYNGSAEKSPLEIYKGKIAVLDLYEGGRFEWPTSGRKTWYVINSIFNDNFLVRTDAWELLLITIAVCGSAVLINFFPAGRMVAALCLVGVAFFFYCRWLVASQNLILDPLYPLFTLALSLAVFPVVKLAHERTSLQEQLKLLQAEKSQSNAE